MKHHVPVSFRAVCWLQKYRTHESPLLRGVCSVEHVWSSWALSVRSSSSLLCNHQPQGPPFPCPLLPVSISWPSNSPLVSSLLLSPQHLSLTRLTVPPYYSFPLPSSSMFSTSLAFRGSIFLYNVQAPTRGACLDCRTQRIFGFFAPILGHICGAAGSSHYGEDAARPTLPLATACSVSPGEGCKSVWSALWPGGTQTPRSSKRLWYMQMVIFPQRMLCPTCKWWQWLQRGQFYIIPAWCSFLFSPQPMPTVEHREGDLLIVHEPSRFIAMTTLQRPGGTTMWTGFSRVHSCGHRGTDAEPLHSRKECQACWGHTRCFEALLTHCH